MQVRQFDSLKDYSDVSTWWKKQDWPVLPLSMLTTSGFIVENDENKLAATWVFKTNCPVYIMEWTVGNPDVKWEDRQEAIKMLTSSASEWAKKNGASYIMTMTKSERFMDKLQEYGFTKMDTDMTHLIRSL